MSTPNQDDIKELLPLASNEMLDNIEQILELIDCPEDFRGLQKVHASLLYLFKLNQAYFSQAFEIDIPTLSKLFDLFTDINPDYYKQYSNSVSAKGWMSQRPLYSLLFIFYDHQNELAANALLFFIPLPNWLKANRALFVE
ncbi:hypothetical protein [Vibrio sp. E14]|uniref:hypothetical protein n=1 Tax=Vibrio sp. E14 TaxID=2849869 RepID=UPI001CF86759|nr:hypothetical protein [Vibrio sp. E14]